MDPDTFSKALVGAVSASPFAALAIWVIRWAFAELKTRDEAFAKVIAAKDARIESLTNSVINLARSGDATVKAVTNIATGA